MVHTEDDHAGQQSDADQTGISEVMGVLRLVMGMISVLNLKVEELQTLFVSKRKDNFTVKEFADAVGRSDYTVRRWNTEKKIKAERIKGTGSRGKLLIPRKELERIIETGLGESVPDGLLD